MSRGGGRTFNRFLAGSATLAVFAFCVSSVQAMAEDMSEKVTSPDGYHGILTKVQKSGSVRVIVKLRTSFTPESLISKADADTQRASVARTQNQIISGLAATGHKPSSFYSFKYIPHIAMTIDKEALDTLLASPDVETIEEDIPVPAVLDLSVPRIGATTLHSKGVTGKGIAVAVLDTGVDKNHPFLQGSVISEACYSSIDSYYNSSSVCPGGVTESTDPGSALPYAGSCPSGECDHGTHVSGIVAGRSGVSGSPGPGVAPEASIIAIQIFSRFDNTDICGSASPCALTWSSDQIKGLERVYELRDTYKISSVNMSIGGGRYSSSSKCDKANSSVKHAIDSLRAAGIATVIASGNDGYCGYISAPACISSAVSVGATDDSDAVAYYSNSASLVKVFAPGSSITSSIPGSGYESWNGTSMATPHVAGAWALMKQRSPEDSVSAILKAFTSTGVSIKDTKCSSVTKKRINVSEAYEKLPPKTSVSPASVNLGSVRNEVVSSSKTVTISNRAATSGRSLQINSITIDDTDAAGFSVTQNCMGLLARGKSCAESVNITPSTFGKKSATLHISSDDPKTPVVSVKLTATVAPSVISVSPSSLNFGKVQTGSTPVAKTVTIKNTGLSDLKPISFSRSGDASFALTSTTCGASLVKGSTCTVSLTFSPTSIGAKPGSLGISSNDPNLKRNPLLVKLTGTGK